MKKICKRCSAEYEAERHLSRYCSPTCRQYAYLERHGLEIKTPAVDLTKTNIPVEERKFVNDNPVAENNSVEQNPVNDVNEIKQTNTANDNKQELNPTEQKQNENSVKEEKKTEQGQTVNSAIDINALGELVKEIKQLKEQNEKITSEHQQLLFQKQNPVSPTNNMLSQNQNKTFSELLRLRMMDLYGANMFMSGFYDHWSQYHFRYAHWVNERLKSHLKALLKFHKEGSVDINRIKYINNKFEEIKNAFEFRHLPEDYPYINDIMELIRKLQKLVANSQDGDEIEFKIAKNLRVEMRAILIEIGNTVPDVDHSSPPKKKSFEQNSYYLAAKAKGFDVLKM